MTPSDAPANPAAHGAAAATHPIDSPGPDDWLNYGRYADSLWERIVLALGNASAVAAEGKASLDRPGADPLVVGVYGEWGAGKSRMLELVYERAAAENAQTLAQ